jgi:hypothetical protein
MGTKIALILVVAMLVPTVVLGQDRQPHRLRPGGNIDSRTTDEKLKDRSVRLPLVCPGLVMKDGKCADPHDPALVGKEP